MNSLVTSFITVSETAERGDITSHFKEESVWLWQRNITGSLSIQSLGTLVFYEDNTEFSKFNSNYTTLCGKYFSTAHCMVSTLKWSLPACTDLVLQSWLAAFTLVQSSAHIVQFCFQLETMGLCLQVLTAQPVVSWLSCHLVDCLWTQGTELQVWCVVSSLQLVSLQCKLAQNECILKAWWAILFLIFCRLSIKH